MSPARRASSGTAPGAAPTVPEGPSPRQWDAIHVVDRHLLVAAGAGTGKTYTVVQKILYLLGAPITTRDGREHRVATPLRLADIAAITYTNKAAAELKGKLREALRAAGRRAEAYEVDTARVGTIHAFCGDVLREFALRSGRPPQLALLDEAGESALRDDVVRETLLAALETPAPAGLDQLLARRSVETVRSWVRRLLGDGDALRALGARGDGLTEEERTLVALAESARERLEKRLGDAGQMDFDRMISWTRDLVRDHADVRRALQRRVRVLIVDEFQDVDPVQRELAYLLAEPESGRADTTRLVLVGDPKQSIYRFRRADVTVWRGVERDFRERGQGEVIQLDESRRSVPALLGFVDDAIGTLLDAPVTDAGALRDFEVPYAPLAATRTAPAGEPAVEMLVVPPDADGTARRADDVRRAEARAVARRARELHDDGVRWGDMALLFCGWGSVETYIAALDEARVPRYVLRGDGFWSLREVLDVLVALRAIASPEDDRALLGFLRSPMVGVADETLLSIARQAASPVWRELGRVTLADAGERALLDRGLDVVRRLAALRDRIPLATLVERLLAETAYLAHLRLLEDDGPQRIANVRKLVRIAGGMRESGVSDLLSLADEARELRVREGSARLHGEGDDVVTITTVHSAKGLEWPVVFWCDLVRVATNDTDPLLVHGDRLALNDPDAGKDEQPARWTALKQELALERQAESKRLWYVAATRARDRLILGGIPIGTGGRLGGSPAGWLKARYPALDDGVAVIEYRSRGGAAFEAEVRVAEPVAETTEAAVPEPLPVGDPAALTRALAPVVVPAGRMRHSATELIALERCGRRHWLRYVLGLREPDAPARGGAEELDAISRGLIVHDVLERVREEDEVAALLEEAIGRWDPGAPPPEGARGARYREQLAEEIALVREHPEYRAVADRPGARRELPFLFVERPGAWFEGKLDLAAPDDGSGAGYAIVDVKTSRCDAEVARRKAEQYAAQRAVYVRAVEAIAGGRVGTFAFQYSRAGVQVGGAVTDALRRAAEARVAGALARLTSGAGATELTSHPAECRFCGYRAAGLCPGVEEGAGEASEASGVETEASGEGAAGEE